MRSLLPADMVPSDVCAHGVVIGMVQYTGMIPLLVAIAHQGSMPEVERKNQAISGRKSRAMSDRKVRPYTLWLIMTDAAVRVDN